MPDTTSAHEPNVLISWSSSAQSLQSVLPAGLEARVQALDEPTQGPQARIERVEFPQTIALGAGRVLLDDQVHILPKELLPPLAVLARATPKAGAPARGRRVDCKLAADLSDGEDIIVSRRR